MISNLKDISDGNARFIENEQTIADRKIEKQKELLEKRKGKVEDLHAELE